MLPTRMNNARGLRLFRRRLWAERGSQDLRKRCLVHSFLRVAGNLAVPFSIVGTPDKTRAMENQTRQKQIIKRLNIPLNVIWVGWVIWVVTGGVSDIFFLNPSYYWIHEIILKWWSDVGIVLAVITIIVLVLRGILMMLYRKRLMSKPEIAQQELPKMKNGETVLDYFHRTQDREKKQELETEPRNNEEQVEVLVKLPRETYEPQQKKPRKLAFMLSAEHTAEEALEAFHKFQQTGEPVISLKKNNQPSQNNEEEFEVQVRLPREMYEPQKKEVELVEGNPSIKAFQIIGAPFQKSKEEKELPTKNNNQPSQNNDKK